MTVGQMGMKHPSLAGMVEAIKVSLSREAMHYRFTGAAVAFMKACTEFVLTQKVSAMAQLQGGLLKHFKRILIFDSTSWDISPKLKDVLPGSGGEASEANCKMQVCYEYKRGELSFFELTSGITPDGAYTAQLPGHLQQGDLILFDLGYFNLKTFFEISAMGAYFISRLSLGIGLFDPLSCLPLDLYGILKKLNGDVHQMNVIVGKNNKTQIISRLVCLRVSPEIAQQRRRKLRKTSRKKGRTPSQYHLLMSDWTLMITNVPSQCLPPEMVRLFYTLRWQIELLFKQLKTVLCIHKSNTGKENRLRCEIYGKLIMAVLIHRVHAEINIRLWNNNKKQLSMEKLYKRIQERAFTILDLLLISLQKAIDYLQTEIPRLIKNCLKSSQRSRQTTLEILEFGIYRQVK
jgi:hypothetical protein